MSDKEEIQDRITELNNELEEAEKKFGEYKDLADDWESRVGELEQSIEDASRNFPI